MKFELRLSRKAGQDMDRTYRYLLEFSPSGAEAVLIACLRAIAEIRANPYRWPYFRLTGAPRRGRLVRAGRQGLWVIYRVREDQGAVEILRVWDSRQDPEKLRG